LTLYDRDSLGSIIYKRVEVNVCGANIIIAIEKS
jgi:hypothetical protein